MPRFLVALAASFATASAALAGGPPVPTLYAVERDGYLDTVDPLSAEILTSLPVTLDGYSVQTVNGLARHPATGVLYAVVRADPAADGFSPNFLVTLDPETGAATLLGDLGDRFAGLAFLPDGTLLGVTGDGANIESTLFKINPATAVTSQIASLGNGDDGEAIATTPDGFIFHASGSGSDDEHFERIDLAGLAGVTDILTSHSYGVGSEGILSLGWSGALGQMFGTDYDAQNLFTIDPATGARTTIGYLAMKIKGLAFDGATLYALQNTETPVLHTLDASDGAVLTSTPVFLGGHTLRNATALVRQATTGTLFAVVREDAGADGSVPRTNLLVTIDPETGEATLIGELGDHFAGLAFRSDGALLGITGFGASNSKSLYRIDTATAAPTYLRSLPSGIGGEQAIATAPDGFLYHAAGYRDGSQYFERLDASIPVPPFITDIPHTSTHTFPFGDAALALGWSDALQTMFITSRDSDLYTVGTSSPVAFGFVGLTSEAYKGIAFDGATCFAACAYCSRLFKIDPMAAGAVLDARDVTLDGHFVGNLLGLAKNPIDGLLYTIVRESLVDGADHRYLCTLDPVAFDGVATLKGELPDRFAGIAFRANGTLIGVTGAGAANPHALWTLDTTNATATFLMDLPNGTSGGQAIAIASDGFLYHAAGNDTANQFYERIDLDALTIEVLDLPPVTGHSFPYGEACALAFSSTLATMHHADLSGDLWTIDTSTGDTTYVGTMSPADGSGVTMKGLAFADVIVIPCPGDTNGDRVIDFFDLNNALSSFGIAQGEPGYIAGADLNGDHVVDFLDLNIVLSFFGTAC